MSVIDDERFQRTKKLPEIMKTCGKHAGECPQVSNSEGTFCTLSGVQLAGPEEIEYDYTRAGNRCRYATSAATKRRRQTRSIQKKIRSVSSPDAWKMALVKLCPELSDSVTVPLSRALLNWSRVLNLCRKTHPALRSWPLLFTATVTSHMAEHTDGNTLVPSVPFLSKHCPAHSDYKGLGVTCRSMSVTWRAIRAKALGPTGAVKEGFELRWKPPKSNI